jgi:hypothetical protein
MLRAFIAACHGTSEFYTKQLPKYKSLDTVCYSTAAFTNSLELDLGIAEILNSNDLVAHYWVPKFAQVESVLVFFVV